MACTSVCTRSLMCSVTSSSTVVAPRRARTAAGIAGILRTTGCRGAFECPHLGRRQLPPLPPPQSMVGDRPDARPHEPDDGMPDGLAHAPHLTVPPLVDGDAQLVGSQHSDL